MQLKKASKKTTNNVEKTAAASEKKIVAAEAPKARVTKSTRAKKVEGAEMTSGKNLHKAATPAASAAPAKAVTTPHVEAKPVSAQAKPVSLKKTAQHHEIAQLAYSYFIERGHAHGHIQHGHAQEDWLRAERELNAL